jgi:hypothetical protein
MHRFYFFDRQPVREAVDPRRLQFHRVFEGSPSFLSQRDELSSPVMRIDPECDETLFVQVVDDPLHVLTIGTEVASKPRNRLMIGGSRPAGAMSLTVPNARILSRTLSVCQLQRHSVPKHRVV